MDVPSDDQALQFKKSPWSTATNFHKNFNSASAQELETEIHPGTNVGPLGEAEDRHA